MNDIINKIFIRFAKRSEKVDPELLLQSFVDVGPLFTVLSTTDNQIIYGRRGTGKTHALIYLAENVKKNKDIPVYIDLRTIGSTGGLYSDSCVPITERATRLLIDTLAAIHDGLYDVAVSTNADVDLSQLGPVLDDFASALSEVKVLGNMEVTTNNQNVDTAQQHDKFLGSVSSNPLIEGSHAKTIGREKQSGLTTKVEGTPTHRVHFGKIGSLFDKLGKILITRKIWILLDEWSAIPLDLQPYLADLIRRSIFPSKSMVVKIGAIEKRSKFQLPGEQGDYIGIEIGADASADLNMDDLMVFDNDEFKATKFFKTLIFRHFFAIANQDNIANTPKTEEELIRLSFTQENVFTEFVRATEGIPRDAFNILSLAAQNDVTQVISMNTIRKSSKTWYQRDKETAVSADQNVLQFLHWIIDKVIAHRRARAFLLERSINHDLIDKLFDSRVLHLLKKNISASDQPGLRYDAYKIDYGCYVDLLSTGRSPEGLLNNDDGSFIQVPPDDYRAIRRAILDIGEFRKSLN